MWPVLVVAMMVIGHGDDESERILFGFSDSSQTNHALFKRLSQSRLCLNSQIALAARLI